jgi:hypothetical protein
VYWKPIYAILEGALEIVVANAQHIKKVPGRKTDVKDGTFGLRRHTDRPTTSGIGGDNFHDRDYGGSRWRLRRTRCAMGFECQLAAKSRSGRAVANGKGGVEIVIPQP